MTATTRTTAVGVFEDQRLAQDAVEQLKTAGFDDNQIGVASRDTSSVVNEEKGSYAGEGALAGMATGAGVGGLWALGIAAGVLPAIGPVIAGGILAAVLASAGVGAAAGGLVGALIGMGIPEEEAAHYQTEFEAGRTIVAVKAGARYDEAVAILTRCGARNENELRVGRAHAESTGGVQGHSTIHVPVHKDELGAHPTYSTGEPKTHPQPEDLRREDDPNMRPL